MIAANAVNENDKMNNSRVTSLVEATGNSRKL